MALTMRMTQVGMELGLPSGALAKQVRMLLHVLLPNAM
jgi:hypothetical protein